jgi:hypothetical protein
VKLARFRDPKAACFLSYVEYETQYKYKQYLLEPFNVLQLSLRPNYSVIPEFMPFLISLVCSLLPLTWLTTKYNYFMSCLRHHLIKEGRTTYILPYPTPALGLKLLLLPWLPYTMLASLWPNHPLIFFLLQHPLSFLRDWVPLPCLWECLNT